MIIFLTCALLIYIVFYFKEKNSEVLVQKIVFNVMDIVLLVIGIVLILLQHNLFDSLKYIVYALYGFLLAYHLIFSIMIKGFIFLVHLFSKSNREADKNYKIKINMFPAICYAYVLAIMYLVE